MEALLSLAFRISVMYAFALTLLRLAGKRSIGDLSALDFLVILIIGDQFDDVFWMDIPLSQGLVGMATIVGLHMLVSYAGWRSQHIHNFVASTPTPVVQKGELLFEGMRQERTPEQTVLMALRMLGEDSPHEVREGAWEPNGQLSVLKIEKEKPLQKGDLSSETGARS